MSLIQCAKNCKHQNDGYCMLDTADKITNLDGGCPHYLAKDFSDGAVKMFDGDNFNAERL